MPALDMPTQALALEEATDDLLVTSIHRVTETQKSVDSALDSITHTHETIESTVAKIERSDRLIHVLADLLGAQYIVVFRGAKHNPQ